MFKKKTCPVCEKPITGRSDKRFCSIACKNTWHFQQRRQHVVSQVNDALQRNRSIIEQLIPKHNSCETLSRKILENLGFQFEFFTGMEVSPDGKTYRIIYDYSWEEEKDGMMTIRRLEEEEAFRDEHP